MQSFGNLVRHFTRNLNRGGVLMLYAGTWRYVGPRQLRVSQYETFTILRLNSCWKIVRHTHQASFMSLANFTLADDRLKEVPLTVCLQPLVKQVPRSVHKHLHLSRTISEKSKRHDAIPTLTFDCSE